MTDRSASQNAGPTRPRAAPRSRRRAPALPGGDQGPSAETRARGGPPAVVWPEIDDGSAREADAPSTAPRSRQRARPRSRSDEPLDSPRGIGLELCERTRRTRRGRRSRSLAAKRRATGDRGVPREWSGTRSMTPRAPTRPRDERLDSPRGLRRELREWARRRGEAGEAAHTRREACSTRWRAERGIGRARARLLDPDGTRDYESGRDETGEGAARREAAAPRSRLV
jgi:hypothetical protein